MIELILRQSLPNNIFGEILGKWIEKAINVPASDQFIMLFLTHELRDKWITIT
jgi:hypothetical protein